MSGLGTKFVLQQIAFQSPLIIVALVGAILGLFYYRRAGKAAIFCISGCVLLSFAMISSIFVAFYLYEKLAAGWPMDRFSDWCTIATIVVNIIEALAISLLVFAVFVGRPKKTTSLET